MSFPEEWLDPMLQIIPEDDLVLQARSPSSRSVWQGLWKSKGLSVSIKVVDAQNASTKLRQLLHEAALRCRLKYPGISVVYGICRRAAENKIYLVTENLDGVSLHRWNTHPGMRSPAWSVRLKHAAQCIRAVAYVHANHLVHGDLTSYSFLFSEDETTLKLCDLGMALEIIERDADPFSMSRGIFTPKREVVLSRAPSREPLLLLQRSGSLKRDSLESSSCAIAETARLPFVHDRKSLFNLSESVEKAVREGGCDSKYDTSTRSSRRHSNDRDNNPSDNGDVGEDSDLIVNGGDSRDAAQHGKPATIVDDETAKGGRDPVGLGVYIINDQPLPSSLLDHSLHSHNVDANGVLDESDAFEMSYASELPPDLDLLLDASSFWRAPELLNTKSTHYNGGNGVDAVISPSSSCSSSSSPSRSHTSRMPTQAADVFALGTLLWEIAARMEPFDVMAGAFIGQDSKVTTTTSESSSSSSSSSSSTSPTSSPTWLPIPDSTPQGLVHIIKRCWDEDPTRRPTAAELAFAVETCAVQEGAEIPPQTSYLTVPSRPPTLADRRTSLASTPLPHQASTPSACASSSSSWLSSSAAAAGMLSGGAMRLRHGSALSADALTIHATAARDSDDDEATVALNSSTHPYGAKRLFAETSPAAPTVENQHDEAAHAVTSPPFAAAAGSRGDFATAVPSTSSSATTSSFHTSSRSASVAAPVTAVTASPLPRISRREWKKLQRHQHEHQEQHATPPSTNSATLAPMAASPKKRAAAGKKSATKALVHSLFIAQGGETLNLLLNQAMKLVGFRATRNNKRAVAVAACLVVFLAAITAMPFL